MEFSSRTINIGEKRVKLQVSHPVALPSLKGHANTSRTTSYGIPQDKRDSAPSPEATTEAPQPRSSCMISLGPSLQLSLPTSLEAHFPSCLFPLTPILILLTLIYLFFWCLMQPSVVSKFVTVVGGCKGVGVSAVGYGYGGE